MREPRFEKLGIGRSGQVGGILLLGILLGACSSSASIGGGDRGIATARTRTIDHEPCDLDSKSAERVDANGDGQPDLVVVKSGSKEVCRAADLDFDRNIDMWTYLDDAGRIRRRELDYDRDGSIDEIQLYQAGLIAEKQRASTPAKRLDTWEFFNAGRLARAERDSDGDGHVDQWWDYKTPDCPLIRTDNDGNGQPDPKSEVDYCKESGYKPPEPAAPTATPVLQKETAALPTETSNTAEKDSDKKDSDKKDSDKKDSDKKDSDKKDSDKKDSDKNSKNGDKADSGSNAAKSTDGQSSQKSGAAPTAGTSTAAGKAKSP